MARIFAFCLWLFMMPSPAVAEDAVSLVAKIPIKSDAKYEWNAYRLTSKITGEFQLWHRGPSHAEDDPLPVIFLLGGLGSHEKTMDLLGDLPDAHIFTLDYGWHPDTPPEAMIVDIFQRMLKTQAEILASYVWIIQNAEKYDLSRLSSVNVSYGTFIAPFVLRAMAKLEIYPRATVFAFGGAGIKHFTTEFIGAFEEADVRERAMEIVSRILDPVDPARHLPHLRGPFLVIQAANDKMIPPASAAALVQSLPAEGKTLKVFDVPHIGYEEPDAIEQMRRATIEFLEEHDAL